MLSQTQIAALDRDILKQCLEAFEAIPVAASSRKMLKRLGVEPGAYAGNGSHLLARQMAKEIRRHLGGDVEH
jgi:hypothetical protein